MIGALNAFRDAAHPWTQFVAVIALYVLGARSCVEALRDPGAPVTRARLAWLLFAAFWAW